jgi:hypothetical protein
MVNLPVLWLIVVGNIKDFASMYCISNRDSKDAHQPDFHYLHSFHEWFLESWFLPLRYASIVTAFDSAR